MNVNMESRVRGFSIHFTGRSGSTFIIYTLRKHPQIYARAEVFGNKTLPGGYEQTSDNQIAFLRKYWRNYKIDSSNSDEISRGFKVQIIKENQQLQSFSRYIKICESHDVAKLFLYRRNHVKQVISALRATQVKSLTKNLINEERAHVFNNDVAKEVMNLPKLHIQPLELKRRLLSLKSNYKILDNLKNKMGGGLELFYEDVLANRQSFFDKIFCELNIPSINVTDSDETKKITSDNLEDVIENYDEIVNFFANSEYADQLIP